MERGIHIRSIQTTDSDALCQYINTLSEEKTFIRFQGEKLTFEEEQEYINRQVIRIAKHISVHLAAFDGDNPIGVSGIDMRDRVESHVGEFGISIAKPYRGMGIGKLLMDHVLQQAEIHLPQLRIIILSVFSNNIPAIRMYERFGFREYGRLPDGFKHNDAFIDQVHMHKTIRI